MTLQASTRVVLSTAGALALAVLLWRALAPVALAAGVVTDCSSDADFANRLAGGGLVVFNCGGTHAPATIQMSNYQPVAINTTIDGGGLLTLDGHNATIPRDSKQFQVSAGATLTLSNITLVNGYANTAYASGDGGCIHVGDNSTLVLLNVTLLNCRTPDGYAGGGIYVTGTASLNMMQSTLSGSSASDGGGIYNAGTLTLSGSSVSRNSASAHDGGGILNTGRATLIDSAVISNTATQNGGGIKNSGTATLDRSTLRGNAATSGGALINSGGTAVLNNSTLDGNQAFASGGGILNAGNTTLSNSTLSNNLAATGGGAIDNIYVVTLTNVTLSSNTAAFGGGIANIYTTTLTNATLAGNSASDGGGIYQFGGSVMSLKNSIVAYSASGGNCSGSITAAQYSISSDETCALTGTVKGMDPNSLDPLLTALDNYGGPTQVHMLKLGSPAIDGVVGSDAPASDQRGVSRPQPPGGLYDIGSVERRTVDADFPPRLYLPLLER